MLGRPIAQSPVSHRGGPGSQPVQMGFVVDREWHCEPGSSVYIVPGYGLDDQAIEVRSPAEAKEFFL
jgi:hypothetical protein